MPNPLHPDLMSAGERIAELTLILARGLVRLKGKQSTHISANCRESFLAFPSGQSPHGVPEKRRMR